MIGPVVTTSRRNEDRLQGPVRPLSGRTSELSDRLSLLRFPTGIRVEGNRVGAVTNSLRQAVMRRLADPLPPEVSGHDAQDRPHVAYLPLLDLEEPAPRGDVRGVAVLCPPDQPELADVVHRGLTAGPAFELQFSGASLRLRTEPDAAASGPAFTGRARTWATATPVVLDRFPGKGNEAAELTRSCRRIGLPDPLEVEAVRRPFLPGGVTLLRSQFPRAEKSPRPFLHARIRFPEPVEGPVLLGAQRYLGMGLFWPID